MKLFLNQSKFENCQQISLNLVCHTDNNALYYEKKSLKERFPQIVPVTKPGGQVLEVKTIIRGHINGVYIKHNHLCDTKLNRFNNTGGYEAFEKAYATNPDQKYYYIDHYFSKSTEEFITKITKGDAVRNDPEYIYEKVHKYFDQSEITKEKIDMIEQKAKLKLDEYRKLINGTK